MKYTYLLPLLGTLALPACMGSATDTPDFGHDDASAQAEDVQVVVDEPIAELDLGSGQRLSFYAWPDGSAGVLSRGTLSDVALLDLPEFSKLSVTELFWGLSAKGAEIPAALERHHALVTEDEGRDAPLESTEQGWILARLDALRADTVYALEYAPCNNTTFSNNHCTSATYPDGPSCFFDASGTLTWTTGPTSRFRAGFCIDQGSAKSVLTYNEYLSDCTTWRDYNAIWGGGGNTVYQANTYLNWWWIGPSGAAKRTWTHRAEGVSNANFDWGTKFLSSGSCGPI